MYYVYELVNLLGTVEWVGQTVRPKIRFSDHTRVKPKQSLHRSGKFYGRQDISMHIVATYATEEEARDAEEILQLFWGLSVDRDKCRGELHYRAKLTEDKVREIKSLLSQKITCAEIGKRFGVGFACIHKIKTGRRWAHVK